MIKPNIYRYTTAINENTIKWYHFGEIAISCNSDNSSVVFINIIKFVTKKKMAIKNVCMLYKDTKLNLSNRLFGKCCINLYVLKQSKDVIEI